MTTFFLPIAKTDIARLLLDKIHNNIYQDNNEKKTDRFGDVKIVQTVMYLIVVNKVYYKHFRILEIPKYIKYRCTISYDDNKQECIFLLPDGNDPENKNMNEISELSYEDIKCKLFNIISSKYKKNKLQKEMKNITQPK